MRVVAGTYKPQVNKPRVLAVNETGGLPGISICTRWLGVFVCLAPKIEYR